MKILDIIKNPLNYYHDTFDMETFKSVFSSNEDSIFMITPVSISIRRKEISNLFDKYYLSELFELSNCYIGIRTGNEHFLFLHLTKKKVSTIKISLYNNYAHIFRDDGCITNYKTNIPSEYKKEYIDYLSILDEWMINEKMPQSLDNSIVFTTIDYSEFNPNFIIPTFYSDKNKDIRDAFSKENIIQLSDVAEVLESHYSMEKKNNDKEFYYELDGNSFPSYPYFPEKEIIKTRTKNTVVIQKNDILENKGRFFLIDKETDFDIYLPASWHLIRPKSICPEYLFIFLQSSLCRKIYYNLYRAKAGENTHAGVIDLEEFPIVKSLSDDFYINEFKKRSNPQNRYYSFENYNDENKLQNIIKKECSEILKNNNNELLIKQTTEDLKELNLCYENEAYKAAIILAGSILEAFLLDWLSEIDGKDYFKNKVKITYDGKESPSITSKLEDYIELIKKAKDPYWNQHASDAHVIREKRNLVHAKLCLKDTAEINKQLCERIIGYLTNIIDSRND